MKVRATHITVYCLCGGSMTGWMRGGDPDGLKEAWLTVHKGEGHGPATRAQAVAARRRNDRAAVEEEQS